MTTQTLAPEHFQIFDTTLRDGAQQEGLRLSVADKLRIARLLDGLGVTFIEGGWPGANPNDTAFFEAAKTDLQLEHAKLVAFGSTRKAGGEAATDALTQALVDAGTEYICIVAKSHDRHVTDALRTTLDENLAMVHDTVTHLVGQGKHVFVDCEHFFDGYRSNPEYALAVVRTAADAGAEVVVLCDTNGGMLPSQMADIVSAAGDMGVDLGIHCHNDTGCAVANSIAAVEAGAIQVQGTMNGYGERTGNADLTSVIPNLQLKYGWPLVSDEQLASLSHVALAVADITNQAPHPRQPYVGHSSFAHKAGLHASAIKVDPDLYQHIDPALVGNGMRMLISDMSGRANIQIKGEQLGLDLADRGVAAQVTEVVKQREAAGYSYEAADASFELLVRDQLGGAESPFEITAWRVFTEHRADMADANDTTSEATVKLLARGETHQTAGEGNGPVDALDDALTRALSTSYPQVRGFRLIDYRVRILETGASTDATTRTLIDFSDGERQWTTVGVGTNVIESSWEALLDAYRFGLVKGFGRD